jgi:hypothetical protein
LIIVRVVTEQFEVKGDFNEKVSISGFVSPAPTPKAVIPNGPETIVKRFTSDVLWSGIGRDYSQWYPYRTPPAPDGYEIDKIKLQYGIEGDRSGCWKWSECKDARFNDDDGSFQFSLRLQGNEGPKDFFRQTSRATGGRGKSDAWVLVTYRLKRR